MKSLRFPLTPRFLTTVLAMALITTSLFAQATQSGSISGTVTMADGTTVPGVTVTVTSPALMGSRSAYSGDGGDYLLRGLPRALLGGIRDGGHAGPRS